MAPQEILVHMLSLKKDALPLKQHAAALTACLTMKLPDGSAAFPSQSLASTLQQLVVKWVILLLQFFKTVSLTLCVCGGFTLQQPYILLIHTL